MPFVAFEEAAPLLDEESDKPLPEGNFCSFMLQQQIMDVCSVSGAKIPSSPIAKQRCMMATVSQAF